MATQTLRNEIGKVAETSSKDYEASSMGLLMSLQDAVQANFRVQKGTFAAVKCLQDVDIMNDAIEMEGDNEVEGKASESSKVGHEGHC